MKKEWHNYGQFRKLEPTTREFEDDQEKKLDADHDWQPKKPADPPIGGEIAMGLEEMENVRSR